MFSRAYAVALFLFFALPLLAVATPANVVARDQCNTGPIQCCQQTLDSQSGQGKSLLGLITGLLGIVVGDITALIGLNCSPITVIGVGGGSCNASPVCCSNNAVGGLISIGCVPITL
ncbi:unnamed protein product [Somion occarium]|uniref:Hydrophobin n=1 Tax=Somion occarium TaxID=3059160 RepID=A0ABP1CHM6_9APHY